MPFLSSIIFVLSGIGICTKFVFSSKIPDQLKQKGEEV